MSYTTTKSVVFATNMTGIKTLGTLLRWKGESMENKENIWNVNTEENYHEEK